MNPPYIVCTLLLVAAIQANAAETQPKVPTSGQIAKILGLDENRVSTDPKEPHPSLKDKIIWMTTYRIAGDEACSMSITIFPNDRIKTDFIEKVGADQTGFQKITREDGDIVYQGLGDSGHMGTFYMTTLINHENDWDMTLMLARDEGVDESKLPVDIAKAGIKLVAPIEVLLRKVKEAQQDCTGQPATRPESKSEGSDNPRPESEGRSR
jgi:hypothetical protein